MLHLGAIDRREGVTMGWREELKDYPKLAPDFELDPLRTALLPIDMQYCDAHPDYGLGLRLRDNYPGADDG